MQRREFARSALLGTALAAVLPATRAADSGSTSQNLVFTEQDPGHWGAASATKHVPQVTVKGGTVSITTPHPQSEAHYIVSHAVILAGGQFLARKTFTYKDEPVSEHKLPDGYKGTVIVASTCNQHDIWTRTVTA